MTFVVAHNTLYNNGLVSSPLNTECGNIEISPGDNATSTGYVTAHVYNNILDTSYKASWFVPTYATNINILTIDSDYNGYKQGGSTYFCMWAYYTTGQAKNYSFGANGPGHAAGQYQTEYSNSTTAPPPANGTGHFGCEVHSVGTGCVDTTVPPMTSPTTQVFTLTGAYSGTSLAAKSWHITEMDTDYTGKARTAWTIGAYEYP